MRTLMWFTLGFGTACAAGVYLVPGNWLLMLALCSAAGFAGLLVIKSRWGRLTQRVLLGCTLGFLWLWGFYNWYLRDARAADGKTEIVTITVSDYGYETAYGVGADGVLMLGGKSYQIRFYLYEQVALKPGDRVEGEFLLQYTGVGGKDVPTYHQGMGIFLLAFADGDASVTACDVVPARFFAARMRRQITNMLDSVFPEDTVAFARALLLGDSTLMTYEMDTAFSVSGIRHVIAVSGLHVSVLFSLVYLLGGKRRLLTALIGIPVLALFAAVAGFTPSIVRACLMQLLMILALLFNREYDPPTALAFAVLTLLAVNPIVITSVSFQLSVGCMIGIFLFSGPIHDYLLDEKRLGPAKGKGLRARLIRWLVGSVSVSLSAMIVTTPLCAVYFDMVSLVSVLTNLLTLWMISFVFYGIMAACILGFLWLPAGCAVAWLISWVMRLVQKIALLLSKVPLAAVYTESVYVILWLVFAYVLLTVFFICKYKRPVLLLGCIAMCLWAALAASWLEPSLANFRVTVLDVGQGQCILLQTEGENYLVDCGGDTSTIAADKALHTLRAQGIFRLDGIILTHYDTDHAEGLPLLLTQMKADRLYLPDKEENNPLQQKLAEEYGSIIEWVPPDTRLQVEKLTLFTAKQTSSRNESSMCVLFQPENCDILITGDRGQAGEAALLEQTALPELELLIVGHHGADDAASMRLLHQTRPAAAAISVGQNRYGHPAQAVLDRLALFGCRILRTDQNGTIIFKG